MEEANINFYLKDGSPCISGGVDSVEVNRIWHNAPNIDFEDNNRPNPSVRAPDIGAVEPSLSK